MNTFGIVVVEGYEIRSYSSLPLIMFCALVQKTAVKRSRKPFCYGEPAALGGYDNFEASIQNKMTVPGISNFIRERFDLPVVG